MHAQAPAGRLKLEQRVPLGELLGVRREKPDSRSDYSFRVATPGCVLTIGCYDADAYHTWQDGLMLCVSTACATLSPARAAKPA